MRIRTKYMNWMLVLVLIAAGFFQAAGPIAPATAAGGANLTLGKTVTASGQSQTYSPDNVKDSNQGTYWERGAILCFSRRWRRRKTKGLDAYGIGPLQIAFLDPRL